MFQYAFAKAASSMLETTYHFSSEHLHKYFSIYYDNTNWFERLKFKLFSATAVKEFNNLQSPDEVLKAIKNNSSIAGYFQSEAYFKNYASEIRVDFKIKDEIQSSFKKKYAHIISAPYCCVAIRLSDYKDWIIGDGLNISPLLPIGFFESALEQIKPERIVFISDQINEVKMHFNNKFPNAIYNEICEDPIEDFQILMNASQSVISNSSFYWWACWLNEKSDKKIYVPQYWLGFRKCIEYPNSIIPSDWIQMPVIY
jgi:hypothetical protein